MSDQVTNVDIDDVLSSIRRLVAEGDQKKSAETRRYSDLAPNADKLVLTPNFRVKETEETVESSEEAIADAVKDAVEIDDSEQATLVLKPEQSIPKEEVAAEINRESLESTIAGLEARVAGTDSDWEPDGSEVKTEVTWASAGFNPEAPESFPPEPEDLEPVETFTAKVREKEDISEREALEDTIVSVVVAEAFAPQSDAPLEPEPAQAFVPHPRPHRWSEQAERRFTPTVEDDADYGDDLAPTARSNSDEQLEKYLNDAPVVDEATLRRLVHEVVREELQGNLGERITRNVRKLVRREIHNILTTQEFE